MRKRPLGQRERVHPAFRAGEARAFALCDGCQLLTYRDQLRVQMEFRGTIAPVPTNFLHCPRCYDEPNPQGMPAILGPDPIPIVDPRPDDSSPGFRAVTATPTTMLPADQILWMKVGAPSTVNLIATPANFAELQVEDGGGNSVLFPITILPNAGTINGLPSYTLASDYATARLVYSNGQWNASTA